MTQLEVRCFGVLEQVCGGAECRLDIKAFPLPVSDALDALAHRHAALEAHLPTLACAVGDEIVARNHMLEEGETLVLLPPVSGG